MRPIFQSSSLWQLFWLSSNSFNLQGMTGTSACTSNSDLSLNLFSVMLVVAAGTARSIAVRSVLSSAQTDNWPLPTCLGLLGSVTWKGGEKQLVGSHTVKVCGNQSPAQATFLHSFSNPLGTWKLFNGNEPYMIIAGFVWTLSAAVNGLGKVSWPGPGTESFKSK